MLAFLGSPFHSVIEEETQAAGRAMGILQGHPTRNANMKEQGKSSDEGNHRLGPSNRDGTLEGGQEWYPVQNVSQWLAVHRLDLAGRGL